VHIDGTPEVQLLPFTAVPLSFLIPSHPNIWRPQCSKLEDNPDMLPRRMS
jgi:hypothetical protein